MVNLSKLEEIKGLRSRKPICFRQWVVHDSNDGGND